MILRSPDKQFSLHADGQIFFQPDPTNPLPGVAVARAVKGEGLLKPQAVLADSQIFEGQDTAQITEKLQQWLSTSIHLALEPLFRLIAGDDHTDVSRAIAESLFEGLGILPRDKVQDDIAKIDEEGRKALRARKVRMGPIILYMPELNKPAAIKLRALLLTLWQDKALPAQTPPDGMVSLSVVDKEIDAEFYSKIGYPVYGPRAVRVDMLDRVICAIYDSADKGIFKAQHKMAEWLGCNIADLYAVLEAMGHTKVSDPIAEQVQAESADATSSPAPAQEPEAPVVVVAEEAPAASEVAPVNAEGVAVEDKPKPAAVKPELATFRLKRNKPASADRPKKPFRKDASKDKDQANNKDKPKFEKKPFKGKPKGKDDRGDKFDRDCERVYSAKAQTKPEDNPFAILQQLKAGNDKK